MKYDEAPEEAKYYLCTLWAFSSFPESMYHPNVSKCNLYKELPNAAQKC